MATVACGLVNMFATLIAIFFCDKWGRKPILYIGLALMVITLVFMGTEFIRIESGMQIYRLGQIVILGSCLVYLIALTWVSATAVFSATSLLLERSVNCEMAFLPFSRTAPFDVSISFLRSAIRF